MKTFAAKIAGLTVTSVLVLVGCGSASGCDGFNPRSEPLAEGDLAIVELQVIDGRWATPDISANYWDTDTPVPAGVGPNTTLTGTAEIIATQRAADGQLLSGVARVDLGQFGIVDFRGPIGCA